MPKLAATPVPGVGVFVLRGDEVLLVRRRREPAAGLWSVPGGRVKLGETLRRAALRELAEECGADLKVNLLGVAVVAERIERDPFGHTAYHYVLTDFVAEYVSGVSKPGSDAAEVRWAGLAEMSSLPVTPGLDSYLRALLHRRAEGTLVHCLAIE